MNSDSFESTHLSSTQNPKVKQLINLRERSVREDSDQFIIEGYRELFRATSAGRKITFLFICPQLFLGSNEHALIQKIRDQGAQVFECTDKVFRKVSYRDRPDGLLAIAPQQHLALSDMDRYFKNQNPFLVIAEAIEKPGNLGTILRSSDAVGVDALIVCDRCTDIHNPNVVRASVGTLFTIPVIEAKGKETLHWVKDHKISILAATPHAQAEYTEVDMTIPLAIVVGTEQVGLSDLWMQNADIQVRIPMHGVADSLNVAMATTLLLYEAIRQRKGM
jgi:RNA methyltransferase, TrmH family